MANINYEEGEKYGLTKDEMEFLLSYDILAVAGVLRDHPNSIAFIARTFKENGIEIDWSKVVYHWMGEIEHLYFDGEELPDYKIDYEEGQKYGLNRSEMINMVSYDALSIANIIRDHPNSIAFIARTFEENGRELDWNKVAQYCMSKEKIIGYYDEEGEIYRVGRKEYGLKKDEIINILSFDTVEVANIIREHPDCINFIKRAFWEKGKVLNLEEVRHCLNEQQGKIGKAIEEINSRIGPVIPQETSKGIEVAEDIQRPTHEASKGIEPLEYIQRPTKEEDKERKELIEAIRRAQNEGKDLDAQIEEARENAKGQI